MQLQRSISLPALVLSRFEFRHSPRFFSFDFHRIASVFHRSTTTVPSVFPQIFFILRSTAFISATDIGKTTRSNRDYIDRKRKKKKKGRNADPESGPKRVYINRDRISIAEVCGTYTYTCGEHESDGHTRFAVRRDVDFHRSRTAKLSIDGSDRTFVPSCR